MHVFLQVDIPSSSKPAAHVDVRIDTLMPRVRQLTLLIFVTWNFAFTFVHCVMNLTVIFCIMMQLFLKINLGIVELCDYARA